MAVDEVEPLLERARARADRLGVGDRFSTLRAELGGGLGDLEYPADLLWASRSLHHVGDQRAALAGFARARARRHLALMEGGLPMRYFPREIGIGRPGLQSRVDAVHDEWFGRMRDELPGAVRDGGLGRPDDRRRPAPHGDPHLPRRPPRPGLGRDARLRRHLLTHRRDFLAPGLDADDLATLNRLLDPDDKASVYHRPDVFLLTAHTVHVAVKPE